MQRAALSTASKASPSLRIMFLGAPGAGKGTYAGRIAPMLDIPTISTGDLVRYEIKNNTALGDKIKVRGVPRDGAVTVELTRRDWRIGLQ